MKINAMIKKKGRWRNIRLDPDRTEIRLSNYWAGEFNLSSIEFLCSTAPKNTHNLTNHG